MKSNQKMNAYLQEMTVIRIAIKMHFKSKYPQ